MNFQTRKKLTLQASARAQNVLVKCSVETGSAVDPILIAENRGCEVRFMALPSLEGVYSPSPKAVIILGSQRYAGRRAFTCAHELGHHEFKHGARLEELKHDRSCKEKDPDEFLADMFASLLLMSQGSVRKALKTRQIQPQKIEPMDIFRLASYFGVSYGAMIDHMTWTLKVLNTQQRKNLIQTKPKELKAQFGGIPQSEVILVDEFWRDRAVDLEIGDILVLYRGVDVKCGQSIIPNGAINGQPTYKAISKGYAQAFNSNKDWAVNIRVTSKHYEGLAQFRFLDDPEEEIE